MEKNYQKEIKEIRKMLNEGQKNLNNFAKTVYDDEFAEGVTFLSKKETNLPFDIFVDCGETYKYFNHPLCLYIVNGENVFPVILSENPYSPSGETVPKEVFDFIRQNLDILVNVANMTIDEGDFLKELETRVSNDNTTLSYIAEMGNYGPDKTGLPIWIYVDTTGSFMKSGHSNSYRIKFQQDKDLKDYRLWMPITIPDLKIMKKGNIPPCKIPQKHVNMVLKWAKGNTELLLKLKNKEITPTEFNNSFKRMEEIEVILGK